MYDFSRRISSFHDDHVRLTKPQQDDMRAKREANVKRIESGLAELGKPALVETIPQGGYKHKTMTQPPEADQESRYDIDLGVVFDVKDTKTPQTTKGWVRDAIALKAKGIMKNEPETKRKCVRVIYANGYQCDFAVMRQRWSGEGYVYEFAAGDEWTATDPRAMNTWVDGQVAAKSPESSSFQARRQVRFGKFYCKTQGHRQGAKFPGGLLATAIFLEHYVAVPGRDDESFLETLRAISYRMPGQPVYANGVQISDEKDEKRIERLIEQAKESVADLDGVGEDANEDEAAKAWKKVFRHSYFDAVAESAKTSKAFGTKSAIGAAAVASPALATGNSDEERLTRMDDARDERIDRGGMAPWSS